MNVLRGFAPHLPISNASRPSSYLYMPSGTIFLGHPIFKVFVAFRLLDVSMLFKVYEFLEPWLANANELFDAEREDENAALPLR